MGGVMAMSIQERQPGPHLRHDAPIVPNVGLGGLELRRPIAEIAPLLNRLPGRYTRKDWVEVDPPWEIRYLLGAVMVAADVRTGMIFKLSALEGYTGLLFDEISVGMTVRDAQRLEPQLYYDEGRELLLVRDTPGVSLDVPEIDPDPAEVPAMRISAISVFAAEIPDYR
jgi:hypothetical protein